MMKIRENLKYIAVEGAIGCGKTSFVEILGGRLNAKMIRENVEENPFLTKFYGDTKRYAFQTQLFFLLSRFKQQQEIAYQLDLFHSLLLSDYYFVKDRIFASINLDVHEMQLYDSVAQILEPKVNKPDLLIYLQANMEKLLKNIHLRNRDYEKNISEEYLAELIEAYNHFFFHYNDAPLLIININDIDFVNRPEHVDEIMNEINKTKIKGTHFFRPLGMETKGMGF